jgi:hypothetical protein
MRVRADWVLLKPGQVEELFKNGPEAKSALPEINRNALDKAAAHAVHYAAQLACFSGQTAHVASGRAKTTATGHEPITGDRVLAFDDKYALVHYGLALQVTPTIAVDSATLDIMSECSETDDAPPHTPTTQRADDGKNRSHRADLFNAVDQHFHTTVQVPLNTPVLVEGMTANPKVAAQGEQWYLIVEVDAEK